MVVAVRYKISLSFSSKWIFKKGCHILCGFVMVHLGLEKVWDVKPLVNGKEIMSVLQLKSGGPLVREWVSRKLCVSVQHVIT